MFCTPKDCRIICYFIGQCSLAVFTVKDHKVSHMVKQKQSNVSWVTRCLYAIKVTPGSVAFERC